MEAPHCHLCHKIPTSLFLLIIPLQLSWLLFLSVAYNPPDKYFINCGSDSNVSDSGRVFVGDSNPLTFFSKRSTKESNKSSVPSPLYQTARTFQRPSAYKFNIDADGTGAYLVRLHFFAFSSPSNLSSARFNVSVPWFWLLQNFSVPKSSNSAVIEEFFVNISSSGSFEITFRPLESSFAFVNAIEVFPLPGNFIPDDAEHVSPGGKKNDYKSILSRVLRKRFRLNVGGGNEPDPLWRNWESDDPYLSNPNAAKKIYSESNPRYQQGDDSRGPIATKYIAPGSVYKTCKKVNIDAGFFNATWGLHVGKNASHLVRVHFCDFMSSSPNLTFFDLYIYNFFSEIINPYNVDMAELTVPFYYDFVVDSDDSGLMNISIGLNQSDRNAFLNALEVMEIIDRTGPGPEDEHEGQNHLPLELGLAFGALALIFIILVVFYLRLKLKKLNPNETLDWWPLLIVGGGSSHNRWGSSHDSHFASLNLGLKIPFKEIQFATNSFDTKRIIGKGGFGNVYQGVLRNGLRVAVKRREPGSGQGLPEFQTEIMVLSKIRHRHLVSLIGYCDERSEMILVYEYMEKGTLRDHLYNSNLPSLSWTQRLEICIGAARGLNYLHKGSAAGIIHRDVKSTNILLDENLIAKVADFGLSRTGPPDQQSHVVTNVKGTFGYLDPEYFRSQQLTEKSDVYSFGVVLLEVLCARPAIDSMLPREQVNLAEWGILCKSKGILEEIIDPFIKEQIDPNSLRKFSEAVEKCLQEDAFDRPSMGDVQWDLEYALQLQRGAKQRQPHEDTSSVASATLQLSTIRRLPSLSTCSLDETDDMPILKDNESDSAVDTVFSQLKIDGTR